MSAGVATRSGRSRIVLAFALVLSALASTVGAQNADGEGGVAVTKPFVVKIHADWCGTCRMLEPTWSKIESEFGDRVHLVKLDVSDRAATEQSRAEAARLGLSGFFKEYGAATGTICVVDGETLEPVAIMRGETDLSKYREAVEKARATSSGRL